MPRLFLKFDDRDLQECAIAQEPFVPELGGTMRPDTIQAAARTERATAPVRIGTLKVVSGKLTGRQYTLSAHTSIIGTADTALVRLPGWFKPRMAAAIARRGEGYLLTPLGGKVRIGGQPLAGRHALKDGDLVEVSGLPLEFRQKSTRGAP